MWCGPSWPRPSGRWIASRRSPADRIQPVWVVHTNCTIISVLLGRRRRMTVDGTMRRRRARLLLAIAAATAVVGGSLAAGAVTVTVTTAPVAGWSTNGAVYATAIVGNTVYAGGNFTQVRNQGGSQTVARTNLA